MTVLDGDRDVCEAVDTSPREPWYGTVTAVIALGAMAVVAVGIAVSAVLVVSREPVGPTGAVVPTRPVTTTVAPLAPSTEPATSPAATRAPSPDVPGTAPVIVPTPVGPSTTQAPPKPRETSAAPVPSVSSPPKSARPTTHQPFPQETTDFLGPPGTNH
jgi:hypothetical protein